MSGFKLNLDCSWFKSGDPIGPVVDTQGFFGFKRYEMQIMDEPVEDGDGFTYGVKYLKTHLNMWLRYPYSFNIFSYKEKNFMK